MPVTSDIDLMAAEKLASSSHISTSASIITGSNDDKFCKVASVSGTANSPVPNRLFRSYVLFDNRDFLPRPFQVILSFFKNLLVLYRFLPIID